MPRTIKSRLTLVVLAVATFFVEYSAPGVRACTTVSACANHTVQYCVCFSCTKCTSAKCCLHVDVQCNGGIIYADASEECGSPACSKEDENLIT
jgi:hypothetical protein